MHNKSVHNISLTVNHRPGVLIRIALVFSRRGYNIESLVVSESSNPQFAHMIIAASGKSHILQQIIKQLSKLIDVVHVAEYDKENTVHRELSLIKVALAHAQRNHALQLIHAIGGVIIEIGVAHCIAQISGTSQEIDNALEVLNEFGILKCIRTGKVVMQMGKDD